MAVYSNEPLPLEGLFRRSWRLYRSTIQYVWIWSFLTSLIFLLSDTFNFNNISTFIHWKYFSFQINLIILMIVFFIPWSFLRTVLLVHMHYQIIRKKNPFLNAISLTGKKIILITIASIIYQAFSYAGFFLFIVPGIYIGTLFFMYLPLIALDNESIVPSFIKAAKLMYGSWWETFLLMAIPTIIVYLVRELMRFYFYHNIILATICIVILTIILPYNAALLLIQFSNLKVKMHLANIPSMIGRAKTKS